MSDHLVCLAPTAPFTDPSTYERLPTEIILDIVKWTSHDCEKYAEAEEFRRHEPIGCFYVAAKGLKRGLAACSLVCRRWTTAIRPVLFKTLVLRHAGDLDLLFTFLDNPTTVAYPSPIENIGIEIDGLLQRPWLHHLPKLAARLISLAWDRRKDVDQNFATFRSNYIEQLFNIHIAGGTDLGSDHVHLLPFDALPRSLPHMHSPLHSLDLEDLRLIHPRSLLRLLRGYPKLPFCKMKRIRFSRATLSSDLPTLARISRMDERIAVKVSQCGDGEAHTQISLTLSALFSERTVGVDDHTWDIVCRTIMAYTPSDHQSAAVNKSYWHTDDSDGKHYVRIAKI